MVPAHFRGGFLLPGSGRSSGAFTRRKRITINENARLKINVSFSNARISETESKTYRKANVL